MTTIRLSPDATILAFLSERTWATESAIQIACRTAKFAPARLAWSLSGVDNGDPAAVAWGLER